MRGWPSSRSPARTASPKTRLSAPRRRSALPGRSARVVVIAGDSVDHQLAGGRHVDVQAVRDELGVDLRESLELLSREALEHRAAVLRDVLVADAAQSLLGLGVVALLVEHRALVGGV